MKHMRKLLIAAIGLLFAMATAQAAPSFYFSEATFLSALATYSTFDFETASGFPASGGIIGSYAGIGFDAKTYDYSPDPTPSGVQGMTGGGAGAGTFTPATLDFTGLANRPHAFGFYALDLTQVGPEVVRVVTTYSNGDVETYTIGLDPGDPDFTFKYLGVLDYSRTIDQLVFDGTELNADPVERAWLIDDLTVGSPVPEPGTIALLGTGLAGLAAFRRRRKS